MNNVDSLFFRGIYQVGVPITRSFRSVVPPGKMRPEIAMHLCALVEDEDQREGSRPPPLSLSAISTLSSSVVSDPPRTFGTPRVSLRETVS